MKLLSLLKWIAIFISEFVGLVIALAMIFGSYYLIKILSEGDVWESLKNNLLQLLN